MIVRVGKKQVSIDLLELQQSMEQCEQSVAMRSTEPTVQLLESVATWFAQRFNFSITLTQAWQLWWAVCELIERSRKRNQTIADIGAWMHLDASMLSELQVVGLAANLPRVKAQKTLHAGNFDMLDYNQVFQLVLLATGDKAEAQRAKAKALELYVDSKCKGNGGS